MAQKDDIKINATILGTGWWSLDRAGPGNLISFGDTHILVDCGRDATTQIFKTGLHTSKISHVFITHQHLDHNIDLIQLIFSSWLTGRSTPLNVFGPKGTSKLIDDLFGENGFYSRDIESRVKQASLPIEGMNIKGIDVEKPGLLYQNVKEPGLLYQTDNWSVTTAATPHSDYIDSWAYRFQIQNNLIDTPGHIDFKSVVVSGDTSPSKSVVELAKDADLLIHECTGTYDIIKRLGFENNHTNSRSLGKIAHEANVKKLALVHFGGNHEADRPIFLAQMVKEVKETFTGEVILGEDLTKISF